MTLLKSVFRFYLESSIHVSLAVVAFTLITCMEFLWPIDWGLIGFVFFGSITGYNFVKYATLAGWHHRSLAQNLQWIQGFSLVCFLALVYCLFQIDQVVIWVSMLLGFFTIFYSIPFFKHKNLRSFSGLKIFIVAFVWAGVTVGLPWAANSFVWELHFIIVFMQRFLWVLVLTFPFEIRDLKYDNPNLGTFPQQLGVQKTKLLGFLLLMIVLVLEGFMHLRWERSMMMVFGVLLTALFLGFAKPKRPDTYAAFWVESIPLWSFVLYWGMRNYLFIS